jgi:hypothetical protein
MTFYPATPVALADRASFKYTVDGRDQSRVFPRQRSGCCVRAV